jgi:hypothetical protein
MGRTTAHQNALSSVEGLIIGARNASSRFPSAIRLDPDAQAVYGMTQEVVQELHFDPRPVEGRTEPDYPMGIEGRLCDAGGMRIEPTSGRVGGALRVEGGMLNCKSYAAYDVTEGLSLEMWIKLDTDSVPTTALVTKGDALVVRLQGGASGGSSLVFSLGGTDAEGRPEPKTLTCPIPDIRPRTWYGIFVSYDGREISVATDEGYGPVRRGSRTLPEGSRLTPRPDADLLVGGFSGWIDDLRVAGIHVAEPVRLPDAFRIEGKARTLRFRDGRPDPPDAQTIVLKSPERTTSLEIAENGMLRISETMSDAQVREEKNRLPEKE